MNHWMITALGMGTVFLALIALSAIISLFPKLFLKPDKKWHEMAPLPEMVEAATARPIATAGAAGPELVAVIAAAVSAASGLAPGSFRIANLEVAPGQTGRGGFTTPVWGHVDRLVRASMIR